MASSTATSRSWRPCTSEHTPILTEHQSGLLHQAIGVLRLNTVELASEKNVLSPRRPMSSTARNPAVAEGRAGVGRCRCGGLVGQ
jgi:hypothetical protein